MTDIVHTALLIVDMQNDFAAPGGMMDSSDIDISDIRTAVPHMAASTNAARAAGMPVIYVKMGFHADLSDFVPPDSPNGRLLHGRVSAGALIRDTWGSDIIEELGPRREAPRRHRVHNEHLRRVSRRPVQPQQPRRHDSHG